MVVGLVRLQRRHDHLREAGAVFPHRAAREDEGEDVLAKVAKEVQVTLLLGRLLDGHHGLELGADGFRASP